MPYVKESHKTGETVRYGIRVGPAEFQNQPNLRSALPKSLFQTRLSR